MSEVEYNNLLYQIRKRLDELDVGEQLLYLCRGKVTARSGENIQTRSLIEELEEKGFLSPDRLVLLKGMLKSVKEWALFQQLEKFEAKRKEYNDLLERIIRVFHDELNDMEHLVFICSEKLTEEMQGNVHDVRSLFKELERNGFLGTDFLDTLKEILTKTNKKDLLKEVEEFEQRQSREIKFEIRKAQAAAILSSVSDRLAGVLNIKTVFKVVAGGITLASSLVLLIRDSSYDQLIAAVNTCVLPAGANLIQITEGCVCLKVQVDNLSALDDLWRLYQDGTLESLLQALLVTDEMRGLAGGEQVEVIVTIDVQEYEKARNELTVESREDSCNKEGKRLKYLGQEKYDYIQNYQDVMTQTSDSGMPGSRSASSDVGTKETSDALSKLRLKDVREEVMDELAFILKRDPVALERFCQSFGLDPVKLRTRELWGIKQFFPDTPVTVLKDVFEALKLFDLAELLEKETKPKALRPALSLKEIEKLPSASDRPTKIYTKAEVLIIRCSEKDGAEAEKFGSFFKGLNKESQVTILKPKSTGDSCKELNMFNMRRRILIKDKEVARIKQKEEKAKKENEKFQMTVSSHIDKWIEQAQDKGNESTLFVLRVMNHDRFEYGVRSLECTATIEAWVEEKLSLIPNTKVVIIDSSLPRMMKMVKIPRETLQVYLPPPIGHGTILELLNKRYKSLDLIAVMLEAKRTFSSRYHRSRIHGHDEEWHYSSWQYPPWHYPTEYTVEIRENLSCLPRLQKKE